MTIKIINPRTEELIQELAPISQFEIQAKIERAQVDHLNWRLKPMAERLMFIQRLADALESEQDQMARSIHLEMGKNLEEANAEISKSVYSCRMMSQKLAEWSKSEVVKDASGQFEVVHEPLGVLLGIMPWNFPLWQVIRFAVPAIGLGNSVLLKHAPNVWGTAQLIERIFLKAGFPLGVYQDLPCGVEHVESIIADERIRGVSLTGSRLAGQRVAEICGRYLKKIVLELGGSDPYIIFEDADIERAARICAQSRLQNSGQSCVSAKRFIVHAKAAFAFTSAFQRYLQTDLAPLARQDLRETLHTQVTKSVSEGAKLLMGGEIPKGPGYFYPPTILTNVKPGMTCFAEELFGPVASIIVGRDEDELIELANQSNYGLGGAIFSADVNRAYSIGQSRLNVGMCFINDMVRSNVEVPFGGVKDSGIGRELGRAGSLEFANTKLMFRAQS